MSRTKNVVPKLGNIESVIKGFQSEMVSALNRREHMPEILEACDTIIQAWCPVSKKDHHSRKISVQPYIRYGDIDFRITLGPSDSIASMLPILEHLEDTLDIQFRSEEHDEFRKFGARKNNVNFNVMVYFKYSNSCSVEETTGTTTVTTTKRKIVCR